MKSPVVFDDQKIRDVQQDATIKFFRTLDEWLAWSRDSNWIYNEEILNSFFDQAQDLGINNLHAGFRPPQNAQVKRPPEGNSIRYDGLSEAERALLDIIASLNVTENPATARICALEGLSKWALQMRGRYARFIGSQYLDVAGADAFLFPIRNEDVQRLNYPSQAFDVIVSIEILEHVPRLDLALTEMLRVLRPGGLLLSTFPFRWDKQETVVRARRTDGKVEHILLPPEYHSAPLDPNGALVFQVPGWDVVDLALHSGASDAGFLFYSSKSGAIKGSHVAGVWIFMAYK